MKKIRWGIIGCGGIADRRTIPGLLQSSNSELVAVMDINPISAENCKNKYNAKYSFTDYKKIIELRDIDAVYIATPVDVHLEQAIAAANAGKHILLEKPLALTSQDAKIISKVCKEKGVKLGVGLMMRFHAYHQEIKKIISSGEIGEIVSMRAQFTCWYPPIENAWRQKLATSGGGALADMGIHAIDLLLYLSGLSVVTVIGFSGNQIHKYEVEDAATILMKMENGSTAIVESSFNIPDEAASAKLEFYGTEGSIFADGTLSQEEVGSVRYIKTKLKGYDAQQSRETAKYQEITADCGNMYEKQISAFANCILNNTVEPISASEAINVQKIIESAYKASKESRYIML